MIRFNILGLFGVVIGGLGILGVLWIFSIFKVKDFGLSNGEVFVYIVIIGSFISSVYSFFAVFNKVSKYKIDNPMRSLRYVTGIVKGGSRI